MAAGQPDLPYRCAVPMLTPSDPLPTRPSRVLVAGTSGSGKTTVAARLAEALGTQHIEIDALFHGPNWTPREEFLADVEWFSSEPTWVTEWQYSPVRPLLAERADLVVWLDLPRFTVMRQVVNRTVRRRLSDEPLWNGNREGPLRTFFTDRDHIVRWAWRTHRLSAERIAALMETRPELPIVRLRSHADVQRWLTGPVASEGSA